MKGWFKYFAVALFIGCIFIALIVWLIYTFVILRSDPELANIYVAIGTLLLAGTTGFLAFFTWLSIKSSIDKEERDRKERWINEISDWLRLLEDKIFPPPEWKGLLGVMEDAESMKKFRITPQMKAFSDSNIRLIIQSGRLGKEIKEGEYAQKLAYKMQIELGDAIYELLKLLRARKDILDDPEHPQVLGNIPEEDRKIIKELIEAQEITEELIEYKTKDLKYSAARTNVSFTVKRERSARDIRNSITDAIEKALGAKTNLLQS